MPFPKTCRGCGRAFVANRRKRDFHSRSCFAQWRERTPEWQAAKRRGQLKSAATKRRQRIRVYAGMAHRCATKGEAFYEGTRVRYQHGWKRGERVGYAAGYEQALRDTRLARTA